MRRRQFAAATAAVVALGSAATVEAQQPYPSKAIRVVIPYPPGGSNEIIGRIMAEELTKRLGQPVLIDNRPGGSTVIGAELVAKSPPDGYTLLATSHTTFAFLPNLRRKLPYDTQRDFEPVSLLATQCFGLVTHPSLPVRTIKDLIALARARPSELTYSSSGISTGTHFSGEQLKVLAGIDIRHIPYKGGAAAIQDVVAGHVSMGFGAVPAVLPFVKRGRLRIIAVTTAKRSAAVPDIPTIGESVPGYEMTPWNAMFAPRGTPRAIIDRLNKEIVGAIKSPEVGQRLAGLGFDAAASSPEQLTEHIKVDVMRYGKLLEAIGFKDE